MGLVAGAGDGVRHHSNVVIVLMGIHGRVMDADVGQTADHIERVDLESFEQYLQIRCEKGAVSVFY